MSDLNPAVSTLPLAIHWLVPELCDLAWPDEVRTTCGDCPMVAAGTFSAETRCCTYQPFLANFLCGRVLGDPDRAGLLTAEIGRGAAVGPLGVAPVGHAAYHARGADDFGRRRDLRCPYFVEGALTCGVWPHRNSVCRTWHCRFVHGEAGFAMWEGMRRAIDRAEALLTVHCVKTGPVPAQDAATADWLDWYRWCAAAVDGLGPDAAGALQDEALSEARAELRASHAALDAPMPHVLGPTVQFVARRGDRVELGGFSRYDTVELPVAVFELLSRLDGSRTWWRALEEAEAASGQSLGGEATVRTLWRLGLLGVPQAEDQVAPGGFQLRVIDGPEDASRRVQPVSSLSAALSRVPDET